MTTALVIVVSMVIGAAVTCFDLWTGRRYTRAIDWLFPGFSGLCAVVSMVQGSIPGIVFNGAVFAFIAWDLWRNRPRRKRKPFRVTGVVRDLGHRLAVEPAPAGGPQIGGR